MSDKVQILVEYVAATDKFRQETEAATVSVDKLDKSTKKVGDDAKVAATKTQQASKSVVQSYQQEGKAVDAQAAKVKGLAVTTQQSAAAQQKALASTGSQFTKIKDLATQLGPAIGVAFGVQQVIQFGKASVEAYVDAEKNATLLLNSLQGNEAIQQRLLKQASDFQNTTVYDDDTIIKAQTFLATQGRTEEQITKLIKAATDLSAVTGDDLQTSVEKLDATYEGSIGRLGKLDERFKGLTKEQLANGAAIDLVTEKYAGFAEAVGNTEAGKIAKAQNQLGEFQEFIGGQILLSVGDLFDAFNSGSVDGFLSNIDELESRLNPLGMGIGGLISGFDNFNKALGFIQDGNYEDALERIGVGMLDIVSATNPAIGAIRFIGQQTGVFSDELSEAEQIQERYVARQSQFTKAVTEGGEALEIFYKRAAEVLGATREEFDEYVAAERVKLGVDKEDNRQTQEKITLLQALSNELRGVTEKVQNQVAAGGVIQQADVDRIIELEKRLKSASEEYTKLIQRTRDRTGFNATAQVTVEQTGQFDIKPAKDYAQELFEINEDAGDRILDNFVKTEEAKREQIQKTADEQAKAAQVQEQFTIDTLNSVVSLAGQLNDIIAQRQIQDIDNTKNAQIKAVEESTLSEEEKQKRISELNKKAAQEQYQIQLKQFRVSQALQIANATIQGAQAVIAAFSSGAAIPIAGLAVGPAFAAVAAALAAAQIAIIASQPAPSAPAFFHGTDYVQRGKNKPGRDTIPAFLNEGEAVIKTSENKKYPGLAKSINAGLLGDYVQRTFAAPIIEEHERKQRARQQNELAEAIAVNLTSTKFNDGRLFGGILESNRYLKDISGALNKTPKRRG